MKKKIYFLIGLIVAGVLAYYAGYHAYTSERPDAELLTPMILQKSVPLSDTGKNSLDERTEYYFVKISREVLEIYEMPEGILYESVKLNTLHLSEKEKQELSEGVVFPTLTEVFEFLENSMS